jgi:hypothetical protein
MIFLAGKGSRIKRKINEVYVTELNKKPLSGEFFWVRRIRTRERAMDGREDTGGEEYTSLPFVLGNLSFTVFFFFLLLEWTALRCHGICM